MERRHIKVGFGQFQHIDRQHRTFDGSIALNLQILLVSITECIDKGFVLQHLR